MAGRASLHKDVGDIGVLWGQAWGLKGLGRTVWAQGVYEEARTYFQQALEAAMDVPLIPEALDILVGIAGLLVAAAEGDAERERAGELLALARHHAASRLMTKEQAARLLTELQDSLPSEVVAAAQRRGETQTLDAAAAEILAVGG